MNDAPPHDLEAEKIVIGSVLIDAKHALSDCRDLSARDFHDPRHQQIWSTIRSLEHDGEFIDTIAVKRRLEQNGQYDAEKDLHVLSELMELAETNIPRHVDHLRKLRVRRELLRGLRDAEKMIFDQAVNVTDIQAELDSLSRTYVGKPTSKRWTMKPLVESYNSGELKPEFIINGVLVKSQVCGLGAAEKTFKTGLSAAAGISISTGKPFLGKFGVPKQRRVTFVSLESGGGTVVDMLLRCSRFYGIDLAENDNLDFYETITDITTPAGVREFERRCQEHGTEVCIIDPASMAADTSDVQGNQSGMYQKLGPITGRAQELGVTLVVNLHFNRHSQRQAGGGFKSVKPSLQSFSGAGWAAWMRQWIMLWRREEYIHDPHVRHHELGMIVGGSAGHGGEYAVDITEGAFGDDQAQWSFDVRKLSQAIEDAKTDAEREDEENLRRQEENDRQKVIEVLNGLPDGETASEISTSAKLNYKRTKAALSDLQDLKQIEPTKVIKNGRPYDGFKMTPTQSDLVRHDSDSRTQNTQSDNPLYIKRGCRSRTECGNGETEPDTSERVGVDGISFKPP